MLDSIRKTGKQAHRVRAMDMQSVLLLLPSLQFCPEVGNQSINKKAFFPPCIPQGIQSNPK
jgi:hypothetical protein